jgi:hypothetical protein
MGEQWWSVRRNNGIASGSEPWAIEGPGAIRNEQAGSMESQMCRQRCERAGVRSRSGLGATAGLLLAAVAAAGTGTVLAAPLTPNLPQDYFPLGVFYQPANAVGTTSFDGWKGRGINTLVGYESQGGTVSMSDYDTAAQAAGLYQIRQPSADPTQDTASNLIAWVQPDEPENQGIDASTLQTAYAAMKAANPDRPVLLNFDGSHIVSGYKNFGWGSNRTQADNAPYAAAADWLAQDVYPVTGWNYPQGIGVSGYGTQLLTQWYNKPTFAYIETSNQRLFTASHPDWLERGPTPSEVRGEVWDAIIHGARGIMYFSQSFTGFRYDATPIDVAAEVTKQNAAITGLAAALNSDDAPDVNHLTFDNPGSLEYITRSYNGVTYLIVLNLSDQPTSTTFTADAASQIQDLQVLGEGRDLLPTDVNTFVDSFGPYDVHIYADVPLGMEALAVPEPAGLAAVGIGSMLLLGLRRRGRRAGGICE